MKNLSSRQTIVSKYLVSSFWIIGATILAFQVYHKFGQVEGFYFIPISFLMALMHYLPMKISYDETRIVVSDWFTKEEFKFSDVKALEYTKPTISFHPYRQMEITTQDDRTRKIKFMPRGVDAFKSLFSRGLQGRQKEILDYWSAAHYRQQ